MNLLLSFPFLKLVIGGVIAWVAFVCSINSLARGGIWGSCVDDLMWYVVFDSQVRNQSRRSEERLLKTKIKPHAGDAICQVPYEMVAFIYSNTKNRFDNHSVWMGLRRTRENGLGHFWRSMPETRLTNAWDTSVFKKYINGFEIKKSNCSFKSKFDFSKFFKNVSNLLNTHLYFLIKWKYSHSFF